MEDYKDKADYLYRLQYDNKNEVRKLSIAQRIELLKKLKSGIEKERKNIQDSLYKDLRKHPLESDYTEIFPALSELDLFIKNLHRWAKTKKVKNNLIFWGNKAYLSYEPKGNCLIISPWNYPFLLPVMHLTACVAAGNTAILKPSEFTPHTTQILESIIESTFPKKHLAVFTGAVDETSYILTKKFNHIHFTGSTKVGKLIMQAAAVHLSGLTLELGGKSPAIIDKRSNLKDVTQKLIWGKMVNLGQTCIAPDYVLIHEDIEQDFINEFKTQCQQCFGNDSSQSADLARIIDNRNFLRIKNLIDDAQHKGAKIVWGATFKANENFISPTLIRQIPQNALILEEEIFGPVYPIITYQNKEEALNYILQGNKPLSMYIFSSCNDFVNYFSNNTSAGAVLVNEVLVHIQHPRLPFGGINHSGMGQSTGEYGFKEFSHIKPILKMTMPLTPSKLLSFPYTAKTRKMVNFMLKWL
ncbi:MAG: aldehyde dehydrogenase family protein [Bacteroidia bacterium]|nr:aldehyde dehydrogenase family protein [Bacteroidia bacterium]